MPASRPVRVVTGCDNSMPVRIVTAGGDPVRIVTEGISDPVRVVTSGLSTPVVVISGSTPPTPPTPPAPDAPTFVSAEVGNVDGQTVVVVFSVAITANGGDYGVGFTILVNAAPNAVTAFNHSAGDTIQLTLTTCVNYGDTVTIAYDDSAGQIHESTGVTPLATFGAQAVTNNVAWWESGCAPAPIAVYQPKGAANLAASYTDLSLNGHDAAPGVAPTFNAATGWTFDGATQYLLTDLVAAANWTVFIRVAGCTGGRALGACDAAAYGGIMSITPHESPTTHGIDMGGQFNLSIAGEYGTSVIGFAYRTEYVNGAAGVTLAAPTAYSSEVIAIGCLHRTPADFLFKLTGSVLALVFYGVELNLGQSVAVENAMALI